MIFFPLCVARLLVLLLLLMPFIVVAFIRQYAVPNSLYTWLFFAFVLRLCVPHSLSIIHKYSNKLTHWLTRCLYVSISVPHTIFTADEYNTHSRSPYTLLKQVIGERAIWTTFNDLVIFTSPFFTRTTQIKCLKSAKFAYTISTKNTRNPKNRLVLLLTVSLAPPITEFSMLIVADGTRIFLSAKKSYELFQLIDDFSMWFAPNRRGKWTKIFLSPSRRDKRMGARRTRMRLRRTLAQWVSLLCGALVFVCIAHTHTTHTHRQQSVCVCEAVGFGRGVWMRFVRYVTSYTRCSMY